MKGPSYEKITEGMITRNTSQTDKYKSPIEKSVHLGPNDCPKFQNYLKDIYSKEIVPSEPETKASLRAEIK